MNVKIESEDFSHIKFTLSGARIGFANMMRRYSMGAIPIFAIDSVIFYENTSSMFDEYIANRIGLVPLKMASGYKPGDEVLFSLDAQGPATVYSKDLKNMSDKIKVANENIPLLKLLEEQNLRLEAKARMGWGRKHAKWQTGISAYELDDKGNAHFTVESFGQLGAKDMLLKSADIVEKKCTELQKQLKEELKGGRI